MLGSAKSLVYSRRLEKIMSNLTPQESEFLFYSGPDGKLHIEVFYADETVWLTQKRMAELFGVDVRTINDHLKNIYTTNELVEQETIRKNRIVQAEGENQVEREVNFYNLDVIISVGYRVNSQQATQFRKWATTTLRDFMIKGFALDDERLKNGTHFGKDYFEELLERIREIRASERRFYQKITDIYATAIDYNKDAKITDQFFSTVQNKLHFAIHGQTASELITKRADSTKLHMGLTTWKNSPKGKILKSDVTVAKNYLSKKELTNLNRIVNMYLDYAENQAERRIAMNMVAWVDRLNAFLKFNEYEILNSPGRVSRAAAEKLAIKEYDKFRPIQDKIYVSDFDEEVKKIHKKNKRGSA